MNERAKEFFKPPCKGYAKEMLYCSLTVSIASKIKRNHTGKLVQVVADMLGSQKEMVVLLLSSLLMV